MHKNLLYIILFTALISCNTKKKKSPTTFFAGEIVNPTNDYVVLHKDDIIIDSCKLDENNRFAFNLNSIVEGLYHFDHNPELQYVYLKQGDSLMIRLNTSDFDESLVFSGIGEETNNFLLEMFLAYEEESPIINSYYILNPKKFASKIDSLRQHKLILLQELQTEIKLSDKSLEIINANIDYNYYAFLEKYPFKHKQRIGKKEVEKLPENFYDYRKNLDFNKKSLTYFRPYYNFMKYHFGNLSYMSCAKICENYPESFTRQLHYNKHKLKLIDSLVIEKNLRDNLFRFVAMDYLLNTHDNDVNNNIFIKEFHNLSENNKHISEINSLYKSIQNLQPKLNIPNLSVYNTEGEKVYLQDICKKKNVILYFWSGTRKKHFNNITKRVKSLEDKKNNEYVFYGINLNTDSTRWLTMIDNKNLERKNQYRATNDKALSDALIVDKLNKAIVIKDGVIVDAFSNLYRSF